MEQTNIIDFIEESKAAWEIVVTENNIKLSTGNNEVNINTPSLFIFLGILFLDLEVAESNRDFFNIVDTERKVVLDLSEKDLVDYLYTVFVLRENNKLYTDNDLIAKRRKIIFLKELAKHITYI